MEQPVTAVYEANVLSPAPLRDLLIRIAQARLVRAKWKETIHDEWTRNVLERNPHLSADRLARTRTLMNEAVRDCLVTGFEDLIESLMIPDSDDRHVLAAAIKAKADVIVTYNLADFPAPALAPHGVEAIHPDDFLAHLLDVAPDIVSAAAKRRRESLKSPPKTVEQYLETLQRQGLAQPVSALRKLTEVI